MTKALLLKVNKGQTHLAGQLVFQRRFFKSAVISSRSTAVKDLQLSCTWSGFYKLQQHIWYWLHLARLCACVYVCKLLSWKVTRGVVSYCLWAVFVNAKMTQLVLASFTQLQRKYKLSASNSFRFLQVRNYNSKHLQNFETFSGSNLDDHLGDGWVGVVLSCFALFCFSLT